MTWWKAVSLDIAITLVTSVLVVVVVRPWLTRREQICWPAVVAIVTGYRQGPGFKGRSSTYLVGYYSFHGDTRVFSVVWGPSDLAPSENGAQLWVPPNGVPPLGEKILLHVDPAQPTVVALDDGPSVVSTLKTLVTLTVVILVACVLGIAIWFI